VDCAWAGSRPITGVLERIDLTGLPGGVSATELLLNGPYNNITGLGASFIVGGEALHTLNVANNAITPLVGAFNNLAVLATIDASNNAITSLANAVSTNTALITIDASNNAITSLANAFSTNTALITIDASNNAIKRIDDGAFDNTQALTTINLKDNPLLLGVPSGM
jgi:Leucine-rich repeat (LRR) protein